MHKPKFYILLASNDDEQTLYYYLEKERVELQRAIEYSRQLLIKNIKPCDSFFSSAMIEVSPILLAIKKPLGVSLMMAMQMSADDHIFLHFSEQHNWKNRLICVTPSNNQSSELELSSLGELNLYQS